MDAESHIHLSTTLQVSGELAPDMKWKIRLDGWLPVPNIIGSQERTLDGVLVKHRLRRLGEVVRLLDFKYIVKVDNYDGFTAQQRFDAILAMQGEEVYLVDVLHCNDGLVHTSYVRRMYMPAIADINIINPAMNPLYITIDLQDDTLE